MNEEYLKILNENEDGTFDVEVQKNHPSYVAMKEKYDEKYGETTDEQFVQKLMEESIMEMIRVEKEEPERWKEMVERMKDA